MVVFTKERGGPLCNNCNGMGYIMAETVKVRIASILDNPSIYMGGPSKSSLRKADRITDYLIEQGFF